FAGSATVTLAGVIMYVHGATKVSDAEDELCDRGGYPFNPGCQPADSSLTQDEVDRLNAKGSRGETIAMVGVGTMGVGLVMSVIAGYKGFIAKPKQQERAVTIAPTVSKDGAGATLQVRW
ncbi:MAG TPA: hypothetical protein VFV99_29585, partial [Kofleriaceae bacterium]|nr:hypothetical protein [Kofleriaceae bacterium]